MNLRFRKTVDKERGGCRRQLRRKVASGCIEKIYVTVAFAEDYQHSVFLMYVNWPTYKRRLF